MRKFILSSAAIVAGSIMAGNAGAGVILVGDPAPGSQPADLITVSTTWTNDNTYNLQSQIFVMPGATLTIEPGTVIASTPSAGGSGSLAVVRGGKIIARGTQADPIIFTSTADVATWAVDASHPTGKNPKTGSWREAANEWGNLTLMGNAYISNTKTVPTNSSTCSASNLSPMEGLTADFRGDTKVLYGGANDNDDSGELSWVSIRYGGRVVGLGNELNGLSMGGIGRETDVHHIEIMNNVDDGIETWGGTVNYKYINIWNIGDDSFDVDQGWRGKGQFFLIVQGYSVQADQGSGGGDNCIEIDGAEKADAQPVTTTTLYNLTVIGQPASNGGDHGVAYRDGARVQVRNSIFMDLGDNLINNDGSDGEGSLGYGHNGTLSYLATWTTPFTSTSAVNACADPGSIYTAQSAGSAAIGQGFLNEMTDSVFFRNLNTAYNNADGSDAVGVTVAGGSAAAKGNTVAPFVLATPNANMPIQTLTRGAPISFFGETYVRVLTIDPRAANAAASSVSTAPNDGFFSQVNYRGAFGPDENWLCGWTATDAFGFNIAPPGGCVIKTPGCVEDINGDGNIDGADLGLLLAAWDTNDADADLNGSGNVDGADLGLLLAAWGECAL